MKIFRLGFPRVFLLLMIGFAAGCSVNSGVPTATSRLTAAPIVLSSSLSLREIQPGAFEVTHAFPWAANSLVVEMANSDLVMVGTPYTPEATTEVLAWIRSRFGERKIIEINPGYHFDNLGGNSALITAGIPVYGSDLTASLVRTRGEQIRRQLLGMLTGSADDSYYQALAAIPYVPPSILFPIVDGLTLTFGTEQVVVYFLGPSQAPDKLAVYFPDRKILFGSCMILGGDQIGNTADADLAKWPDAVRKLKQFDAAIVVPGHGDRLDPGLIDHTLELLSAQP